MADRMKVVELDRRPHEIRAESVHARDERDRLTRQLRSALDQKQRAWDQGFAAAIDMMLRGATLERLMEIVRHPGSVPTIARVRGTRDIDGDITQPMTPIEIE